jgi:hypothetical protein
MNRRDVATAAAFSNAGMVRIGPGSTFTVGETGVYTRTAGSTNVDGTLAIKAGIWCVTCPPPGTPSLKKGQRRQ